MNSLLYLMALAYRSGESYERYSQKFEKRYPDDRTSPLISIKRLIEEGRPGESFAEEITDLDPASRGLVLATAIVMFPDEATESWRKMARALVFSAERPAF